MDSVNVAAKGVFGLADSVITGAVVIVGESVSLPSQAAKSSTTIMSAGITERVLFVLFIPIPAEIKTPSSPCCV